MAPPAKAPPRRPRRIRKDKMNMDDLLKFHAESKATATWEMDIKTYDSIRTMKDDAGNYMWIPPAIPGTLLGEKIVITDEPCFRIKYSFGDGQEIIFDPKRKKR